ncbi:MAG: hypothetical protein WA061_04475 [Microgenomates group bacterium]
MKDLPLIRLRNDEYNRYIQDYKEKCMFDESTLILPEEWAVVARCCEDYGLSQKTTHEPHSQGGVDEKQFSIILYIKGNFTLPGYTSLTTERGNVALRPFIVHDTQVAKRMHIVANLLVSGKELISPVEIDEEYIYEALRETSFTMALEEIEKWGKETQSLQISFDEDGHFKAIELDESI